MGLIDLEGFSLQLRAIGSFYCRFGFVVRGHLHEPESLRFAGKPVLDDIDRLYLAKTLKDSSQIIIGNVFCQIAYIDIHAALLIPFGLGSFSSKGKAFMF